MKILGILNITEDSFSDGGQYLEPDAALAHGRELMARRRRHHRYRRGVVQSRRQSRCAPDVEIARLAPVVAGAEGRRHRRSPSTRFRPRSSAGRWRRASTISTTSTAFPIPRSIRELAAAEREADRDACGPGTRRRGAHAKCRRRGDLRPRPALLRARLAALTKRRHRPRAADPGPRHGLLPRHRSGELPRSCCAACRT